MDVQPTIRSVFKRLYSFYRSTSENNSHVNKEFSICLTSTRDRRFYERKIPLRATVGDAMRKVAGQPKRVVLTEYVIMLLTLRANPGTPQRKDLFEILE